MANGVNKVILLGNLGRDPDYGVTQNNKSKCVLNIATGETWKDKDTGENKEGTDWHRVIFYDRLADICGQYLHKGSKIYIEGKNKTASWIDQQTQQKKYMHYVQGHIMQMLDAQNKNAEGSYEPPARQHSNGSQASYSAPAPHPVHDNQNEYGDDDIPF